MPGGPTGRRRAAFLLEPAFSFRRLTPSLAVGEQCAKKVKPLPTAELIALFEGTGVSWCAPALASAVPTCPDGHADSRRAERAVSFARTGELAAARPLSAAYVVPA